MLKIRFLPLIVLLYSQVSLATEKPVFYLGEERPGWGVKIPLKEDSPIQMRLGTRLQTIAAVSKRNDTTTNRDETFNDANIRRARLQVEVKYKEGIRYYLDVRNDNVNTGDSGEGDFNLGDAFVEVKNIFDIEGVNFRAFRAKVDVSRSETVSSSKLIYLTRTSVADEAANFVNHNRRATNAQILGTLGPVFFQLVAGDGVESGSFNDATGDSVTAIDSQKFMIGGKLRISPFEGWEDDKLKDTYFGVGQHFSFGAGFFKTSDIQFRESNGAQGELSRKLLNLEASFHYKNLFIQSEYFKFDGVVEDFSDAVANIGNSDGYYVESEFVLPSLSYLAPYLRYESWDRFDSLDDYDQTSWVAGINWYIKGNNIRMGLFYQYDKFDANLVSANGRGQTFNDNKQLALTTMWHY